MKKLSIYLFMMISLLFTATSCLDNRSSVEVDYPNLGATVTFINHSMDARGSYDGVEFTELDSEQSLLTAIGGWDHISVESTAKWRGVDLEFYIPEIDITGRDGDVEFNDTSRDAVVTYNGVKHTSVKAVITGYIKRYDGHQYETTMDIMLTVDDKPLNLEVLSITSRL